MPTSVNRRRRTSAALSLVALMTVCQWLWLTAPETSTATGSSAVMTLSTVASAPSTVAGKIVMPTSDVGIIRDGLGIPSWSRSGRQ